MTEQKSQFVGKSKSLMDAMERYKATGNNEFFTLADDKDTAIVRFLYSTAEELDWFVVHEFEIGGKKRWVQCSEEADCPGCMKLARPSLKLFIQLMQKGKEDTVMTWERGQKFVPQIMELFEKHGDLTQHIFEIERQGKKGDANTKYVITHIGESPINTDDLLDRQEFLGSDGFILQKSHEEMNQILSGNFQYQKVENPTKREVKKDVEVF
jgi:hypothetical protein